MDIEKKKEALEKLELPDWVKGRELNEDLDYEGDPLIRVWLDIDEDFEFADHVDEVFETEWRIKNAIYAIGRDLWVAVHLRAPVTEE
jgi:hypothetical protein